MNEIQLRSMEPSTLLEEELIAEIRRLRQGLWDCGIIAGEDTDGVPTPAHLIYPDIVEWALNAVRELRQYYAAMLAEEHL